MKAPIGTATRHLVANCSKNTLTRSEFCQLNILNLSSFEHFRLETHAGGDFYEVAKDPFNSLVTIQFDLTE